MKNVLVPVILGLLVVGGVSSFFLWKQSASIPQDTLNNFVLPNRNISGVASSTSPLAYYYAQHALNPVFSLEGVDIDAFTNAATNLQSNLRNALIHFPAQERARLVRTLYPRAFLRTLPITERARRDFLQHPTYMNARVYHYALMRTVAAYQADSGNTEDMLRSFPEHSALAFWQGTTTSHFVAKQLQNARIQARDIREEEARRFACLQGTGPCAAINVASSDTANEHDATERIEVPAYMEIHRTIVQAYAKRDIGDGNTALSLTSADVSDIPLIALTNPACIQAETAFYALWWRTSRTSDIPALRITPVNALLFHDVSQTPGQYYKTLNAHDIPYQYQPLNPYLCMDYASDERTVATAYYIQHQLRQKSIFSDIDTPNADIAALSEYERDVVQSTEILSVADITVYIGAVRAYLSTHNEEEISRAVNASEIETLYHLVQVWKDKSAWLSYTISNFDDMHVSIEAVSRMQNMPLYAFFLSRAYISSLYQFANETVVPNPPILMKTAVSITPEKFHLVPYQQALSEQFTPTQLIEYLQRAGARMTEIHRYNW